MMTVNRPLWGSSDTMTSNTEPFLGRQPLPTEDFRVLVQSPGLTNILRVSYWLREPLQPLFYAAAASPNAFKMALAQLSNHVQSVFMSLKRADARAWLGDSAISFPAEYLRDSSALRWPGRILYRRWPGRILLMLQRR